jgi:NADH-quinone oxidoreductase subunit M
MIFDPLALTSMALFIVLALITLACLPKRDREPAQLASLGCIVAGTLLSYASASLPLFAAGWALTILPYWGWLKTGPKFALAAVTIALAVGAGLLAVPGEAARIAAFGALMLAVLLRMGIFPFHSWIPNGFDQSPILPLALLLNGHLGAFLLVRFVIPLLPELASTTVDFFGILAPFSALYAAVVALSQNRPRRILGFLSVSQASFLLAGLENRHTEGISGALVHWFVVGAATTALVCVYRSLEARHPAVASPKEFLGLANFAPRFAVFFVVSGLALVGLPGTLGFVTEDLLFHFSLESHPLLGITLPLATALNGITLYRLFSTLFLGRAAASTPAIADALPKERWALTAIVAFLVLNGLAPSVLVSLQLPAAERIASLLSAR